MFVRGFRAKRVLFWTRLKGAAEPLPDAHHDRREDEIQVIRVPDVPSVSNFPAMKSRRTKHDVSLAVPRPAHRSVGLSCGGWRASLLPLLRPFLAHFKRSARIILVPWPLPTMMTSGSLNRWYAYICTALSTLRDNRQFARLGHFHCGFGGIVLASK